jgi:hypothetical protein
VPAVGAVSETLPLMLKVAAGGVGDGDGDGDVGDAGSESLQPASARASRSGTPNE